MRCHNRMRARVPCRHHSLFGAVTRAERYASPASQISWRPWWSTRRLTSNLPRLGKLGATRRQKQLQTRWLLRLSGQARAGGQHARLVVAVRPDLCAEAGGRAQTQTHSPQ